MRRSTKIVAWVLGVIVVLIIAVVVFIATFDWNRARPFINHKASDALGRPFAINGDLTVRWRRPPGAPGWRGWIPWPHVTAKDISLGNPDWARQPRFATVQQADFDIAIPPLLIRHVSIPDVKLSGPSVDIERMADQRNNYTFKQSDGSPSPWKVVVNQITLDKGHITVFDEAKKVDLALDIDTLGNPIPFAEAMKQQAATSRQESASQIGASGAAKFQKAASESAARDQAPVATTAGSRPSRAALTASGASSSAAPSANDSASGASAASAVGASAGQAAAEQARTPPPLVNANYQIGWTVKGSFNKAPVSGSGKLGGVLALEDHVDPFPLQADVKIGDTRIALVGTVNDPTRLTGVDMRLWLSGSNLSLLYPLTGVTLPDSPPYATEGRLIAQLRPDHNNVFRYERFTGRIGGSDLNGTLVYEMRKPRPKLSGELVSNMLNFKDLGPLIGANSSGAAKKPADVPAPPPGKVLPVQEFKTDRWNAMDADVKLTGRRIIRDASLPIEDLYTHLILNDKLLTLDPLRFGVAGGTLNGTVQLNGRQVPMKGRVSVSLRHLSLKRLFPTVKSMQKSLGELNGDGSISADGNSVAKLLATSNGRVTLLVNDGTLSAFIMEAAGLNVANAVIEKLYGEREVAINCAASDFQVNNGVLDSRVFVVDTSDAVINVDGNVNMRDETMDLHVRPHTKGFRVFSLRSPLYVRGTFQKPSIGVDAVPLALRGGGAIALGLINPFAALIPLLAPSHSADSPCSELFAKAGAKGPAASAAKADAAAAAAREASGSEAAKPAPKTPANRAAKAPANSASSVNNPLSSKAGGNIAPMYKGGG